MSIWKITPTLEVLQSMSANSLVDTLEITFTELGEESISARMPVDARHVQPHRLLHGGASVVLAETLGSVAANLMLDPDTHYAVGLDINANHLRAVREGSSVVATATPVHLGRTTQVWQIRIVDESSGKLACLSRLTMAVLER